jgi:hypothetical protein
MEIRSICVKSGGFSKYLSIWNKVTLGYALEIWSENVERFPDYDWMMYNNKRLKDADLSEDIIQIREYGILFLNISVKGGLKVVDYFNLKKQCPIMTNMVERWTHYCWIKPEEGRKLELDDVLMFDPMKTAWMFVNKGIKAENRRLVYDNWDLVWDKNHHAVWLAVEDITEMFYTIEDALIDMVNIGKAAVALNELMMKLSYSEDPTDPDTVGEDLKEAREINSILVTVRNCISCLRKTWMLKVVIRKSIDAPVSVFDTQKFLKKYTNDNFKEYYDIVKWSINPKKRSLQYSNEDCAAMKYRSKIVSSRPFNMCDCYDSCVRILSLIKKK